MEGKNGAKLIHSTRGLATCVHVPLSPWQSPENHFIHQWKTWFRARVIQRWRVHRSRCSVWYFSYTWVARCLGVALEERFFSHQYRDPTYPRTYSTYTYRKVQVRNWHQSFAKYRRIRENGYRAFQSSNPVAVSTTQKIACVLLLLRASLLVIEASATLRPPSRLTLKLSKNSISATCKL